MKAVIAIDSFKGSMTSLQAGEAAKNGILRVFPESETVVCPLADGGEGTVEALTLGMGGELQSVMVKGPLGVLVNAVYGIVERETKTAIMEIAQAAGITLLPKEKLNPLITTTFGVGEMILDAIEKGCRNFIIGIGGSATNDGGAGMLQALGFEMCDKDGNEISLGAVGLKDLELIGKEHVIPELRECQFQIACDVTNPLCGPQGCSAVYGPQKGADAEMIRQMDAWLSNYAGIALSFKEERKAEDASVNLVNVGVDALFPGAGAAGGLGFAFRVFMNAELQSGIQIVLRETELEEKVKDADYVITGEGRLDGQTVMGKAPIGVAEIAKRYGKPVLAFSGCVAEDAGVCNEYGIDAFFSILCNAGTIAEVSECEQATWNMTTTVEQIFRLIKTLKH